MMRWMLGGVLLIVIGLTGPLPGQGKKSDSVVKVAATADKPGDDGKQVVTITLAMDEKWHTYANPVDNDMLVNAQTTVIVSGKNAKVEYPPGKLVKEKEPIGDYKVYENKAVIKATVQRAKGDTGPLEVMVTFMACDANTCLLPATVKLTVP